MQSMLSFIKNNSRVYPESPFNFKIKSYPSDIYTAVGHIIENAQKWEQSFKKLVELHKLQITNITSSSLNRLNKKLHESKALSDKDFENLKMVITMRNYINHSFFCYDFIGKFVSYEEKLSSLECILNTVNFYILEAHDLTENKIKTFNNDKILCPTTFDDKQE